MSSFNGQLKRSNGQKRPFILTRAAFVGSQRYAAIWTGDNTAEWDHLKVSLTLNLRSFDIPRIILCLCFKSKKYVSYIFHLSFDSSPSLCACPWPSPVWDSAVQMSVGFLRTLTKNCSLVGTRYNYRTFWQTSARNRSYHNLSFKAAAFQPFMRVHSHIETARREPYLFSQETISRLKAAVLKRYTFMPYWYTLFYEYEKSGVPPMRPVWMEFPCDGNTLRMDDEHMLGKQSSR